MIERFLHWFRARGRPLTRLSLGLPAHEGAASPNELLGTVRVIRDGVRMSARFVQRVDRAIGSHAIGFVAIGELDRGTNGRLGDDDVVMSLQAVDASFENVERLVSR
jgi:hypothetical protein